MNTYIKRIIFVLLLSNAGWLHGESTYVMIVHPANEHSLSIDAIRNIYHGRVFYDDNKKKYVPLILPRKHPAHAGFSELFMRRTSSQLNSLWAKLLFTGKGSAPKQVKSVSEMKELVSTHEEYIGYIPVDQVDDSVRAIFEYPPLAQVGL